MSHVSKRSQKALELWLPPWIPPQLTQLSETAPSGSQWIYEIKLDGFRMAARIERGRPRLLTRTGLDWSDKYPTVVAALAKVQAKAAYLDGELCGVGDDGFLVCVLPPVPRCSDWVSSSLISPSRISLPRNCSRVGLHIVLFEACSAFTRVAARTLARSPIRDPLYRRLQPFRHLHDYSGCFRLERSPGGTCTHWKAPPSHGARKSRSSQLGAPTRPNQPPAPLYDRPCERAVNARKRSSSGSEVEPGTAIL